MVKKSFVSMPSTFYHDFQCGNDDNEVQFIQKIFLRLHSFMSSSVFTLRDNMTKEEHVLNFRGTDTTY
ncbi:CLUMA_CG003353, isoform A [Clunio marinus]|uniref:CLUMA_CG003353, isoform A n=1 Tax=Clunio marinus TaxID=568069 RepID=A0A1J1HPY1_9DIPT|nr:CLUMA_CG003353, isoform A [Clunio marinus]